MTAETRSLPLSVLTAGTPANSQLKNTHTRAALQPGVPEVRRYRLRYLKDDLPAGSYNDVMIVTTIP